MLQSLLSNLAAAGLATKAAAGGAAVVVAASAAGAADALPDSAQNAFDEVVTVEATADDNSEFGSSVADDATGESDEEPGVDGCEVAREASGRDLDDCGDDTDADEDEGNDFGEDFGARVSEDASDPNDPGVDGDEISEEARALNPGAGAEGAGNAPDDVDTTADDTDDDDGPEGTPGEDAAANARSGGDS